MALLLLAALGVLLTGFYAGGYTDRPVLAFIGVTLASGGLWFAREVE